MQMVGSYVSVHTIYWKLWMQDNILKLKILTDKMQVLLADPKSLISKSSSFSL